MSQIHVITLLAELDKAPASVFELSEQTGYPTHKVFDYIMEARRTGHRIAVFWREGSMSEYKHEECACGDQDS